MKIDDERVRRALHHRAERIEPADGSWDRIQADVAATQRQRRLRSGGLTGLATAAVMALVFATLGLVQDENARVVETRPAAPSSPATTDVPPSPPETLPQDEAHDDVGLWPFATRAELLAWMKSGDLRHDDPSEAARAFAVEYLGMVDPIVGEPFGPGPDGTVEVTLAPRGEGGQSLGAGTMETIVHLDPSGPPWQVLFTRSSNIRLVGPTFRNATETPIAISGQATAYEGTVQVEVRGPGGATLGRDFVTAGALGTFGPFDAEIAFEPPSTEGLGALVLFTESAVDGSTLEATVVSLNFGASSKPPPTTSPSRTEVTVFFHRDEELVPVTRLVPATTGVLRASLEQLLAGPTEDEQADGLRSPLSPDAAGMLQRVSLAEGKAVVDFVPGIIGNGNASTSTGSGLLLDQLNATVFQFPTVSSVEYRLDGSCEAFYEWLQRGCEVVARPGD